MSKTNFKGLTRGFHDLNQTEFDEKGLTKYLHTAIWTLRGKYGVDNVYVLQTSETVSLADGGHPKEADFTNYQVERVMVVAEQRGKVIDFIVAFENQQMTMSFGDEILEIFKFKGEKTSVTGFTRKYQERVLASRLDYFGKYGLKYRFKDINSYSDLY